MTDAAFLRMIAETPDDDLTRLAYADWLEENGEGDQLARAELIRVQCESERLPEWDKRRALLLRRAKAIIKEHGRTWQSPMLKKGVPRKWTFRRGFVEHVEMGATAFTYAAEKLFEAAPMLRSATFPNASNEIDELLLFPFLARLVEIDLSRMCTCGSCAIDEDQRLLFASPLIAGLRVLRMRENRIDKETAQALAASPHIASLQKLDLSWNRFGTAGVLALAKSPHLAGLTHLDLSGNTLRVGGIRALCEGRWPRLEVLRLSCCKISREGVRILAASPLLASVKMLELDDNPLTDPGAMALVKSRHLDGLEFLDLGTETGFAPDTLKALKARFGKKVQVK